MPVLANEVTARNDLDNAVEGLRQVTGNYYPELASLNVNGFKTNKPQAVNALLKEAENRNLSLLQARLSQDLAREQIRQAQDGHLPTLNLSASTGVSNTRYNGSKTNTPLAYNDSDNGQNQIGLNFSLPLYQGGRGGPRRSNRRNTTSSAPASSWKAPTAASCRLCVHRLTT